MNKLLAFVVLVGCTTTGTTQYCTEKKLKYGSPATLESMCSLYGTCFEVGQVGCEARLDADCQASISCKQTGTCVVWKSACATPADANTGCQALCLPQALTGTMHADGACLCETK